MSAANEWPERSGREKTGARKNERIGQVKSFSLKLSERVSERKNEGAKERRRRERKMYLKLRMRSEGDAAVSKLITDATTGSLEQVNVFSRELVNQAD